MPTSLLLWALSVPEFTSIETFQITGRGTVYIVPMPSEVVVDNLRSTGAIIDGKRMKVLGIEAKAIHGRLYDRVNIHGNMAVLAREIKETDE